MRPRGKARDPALEDCRVARVKEWVRVRRGQRTARVELRRRQQDPWAGELLSDAT